MKTIKIKDLDIGDVFAYDIKDTLQYNENELTEEEKIHNLVYETIVVGIVDDIDGNTIYLNYFGETLFKSDDVQVKFICHYSYIIN